MAGEYQNPRRRIWHRWGAVRRDFVGHFADQLGWVLSADMLHFIQEFGLILFVYTIGIQVGPGFFASLRVSGLRLNLFAFGIVVMGAGDRHSA